MLPIVIFMDRRNVGLAAALNRVADIAAVAAGCPAANCDAARDLRCYGGATQSEFNASKEEWSWPQRDPAAPAGGGRLQFGSIVAHRFDTNGWNRRDLSVHHGFSEGRLTTISPVRDSRS
jgi:hypothetical protein